MKQSRERKTAAPLAQKKVMRGNEMTARIAKRMVSHSEQTKNTTKEGDLTMEATTGFAGFDTKNASENFFKMMKYSLDTTFDSLAKIQEFNDKIVRDTLTASKQIQADAEKIVVGWSENNKKGWDDYRRLVEKGFKQAEELIQPTK